MPTPWRAEYQAFNPSVREAILRRAHRKCQIRGHRCTGIATVADHVVPDFEGGSNDIFNGQAVCAACHAEKTAEERRRARARRSRYRTPPRHPGLL